MNENGKYFTNTTIKYFVDGEFIDNVTVDEVNKIRENVLEHIVNTNDISILNRFYFIGHKDTNNGKMGEEVKITMDNYGNLSDLPWEMAHVRRSMYHLMQIGRKHCELLNSFNNGFTRMMEKEKKPVKVESEFKVGDWITFYGGEPFKILKIEAEVSGVLNYLLLNQKGDNSYYSKKYVDENARLWTIQQDAKDGDILIHSSFMFDDFIFIYNNTSILQAYCYYSKERNKFIIEDRGHHCPWNMQEVTPATKEQRETLERAMTNAGYKWNAEKKELRKIEDKPLVVDEGKDEIDRNFTEMMLKDYTKQKPVDKVEPYDPYEGLTDFERTLADVCIGWIGEEPGWKQYIKDNADVLLKIAVKKFNSVQYASFEQNPAVEMKTPEESLGIDSETYNEIADECIYGKQESTNKIKSKFHEGDSIQFKGVGHDRYTIKEVCGLSHYINTMGNRMDMSYTDANFEVIEDSDKVKSSPAWSEEDSKVLNRISAILVDASEVKNWWKEYRLIEKEEMIRLTDFLKSLKERVLPQPKQEWSEEDEKTLNSILSCIDHCQTEDIEAQYNGNRYVDLERYEPMFNWLKSLKDRLQLKAELIQLDDYNPYKEVVESIAEMCKHYDKDDLQDFYDNVKVKCKDAKEYNSLYSQDRWKPSKKQIVALRWILNNVPYNKHKEEISGLLDQIKDL